MKRTFIALTIIIIILSAIASYNGIFKSDESGSFSYQSIRNQKVEIYGKGLYQHMSKEVAIQGIAQDYITLFIAVPLLLFSLVKFLQKSKVFTLIFGGTIFYFFVTYLLYLAMAMYNQMFLLYVILLGSSFFALILFLLKIDYSKFSYFDKKSPAKSSGIFLIINSLLIALLWLGMIIPPLMDGSIYPKELEHYTTLIVQGFDLALLLPLAFVSGYLLLHKQKFAFVFGTVYLVFLSILMTALTAKIIAMKLNGYNVIPVIYIIPSINLISIFFGYRMLRYIRKNS